MKLAGMGGVIAVAPARWAAQMALRLRPSHVLTLRSPDAAPSAPIGGAGRLELVFNDIVEAREGLAPPDDAMVRRLLAFGETWPGEAPLLAACYAGISRSTAAAYALACQKRGRGAERALAQALRTASPSATPNLLLVRLADGRLGRGGAMTAAIQAIGRGAEAFEGTPFTLDLRALPGGSEADAAG